MKLYKYYSLADDKKLDRFIDSIEHSTLYFSNVDSFNDPFELNPAISNIENSREEKMDMLANYLLYDRPEVKRMFQATLEQFCSEEEFNKLIDDSYKKIKRILKNIGVCCFTKEKNNLLMWAHYADSHKGVCVEFEINKDDLTIEDSEEVPKMQIFPVRYSDQRPELRIDLLSQDSRKTLFKFLTTKSKEWEYEEEYRAIASNLAKNKAKYTSSCLKAIYLGANISNKGETRIRNCLEKLTTSVSLYKSTLSNKKFELVFNLIKI